MRRGSTIRIRQLKAGDERVLDNLAHGVFDHEVRADLTREFLHGAHNLLVVALDQSVVVGIGSGLFHLHPDKATELWINELGVSPAHSRRGIATRILHKMQSIALEMGCRSCWLMTERDNAAANKLYSSLPGWNGPEDAVLYSIDLAAENQ